MTLDRALTVIVTTLVIVGISLGILIYLKKTSRQTNLPAPLFEEKPINSSVTKGIVSHEIRVISQIPNISAQLVNKDSIEAELDDLGFWNKDALQYAIFEGSRYVEKPQKKFIPRFTARSLTIILEDNEAFLKEPFYFHEARIGIDGYSFITEIKNYDPKKENDLILRVAVHPHILKHDGESVGSRVSAYVLKKLWTLAKVKDGIHPLVLEIDADMYSFKTIKSLKNNSFLQISHTNQ